MIFEGHKGYFTPSASTKNGQIPMTFEGKPGYFTEYTADSA